MCAFNCCVRKRDGLASQPNSLGFVGTMLREYLETSEIEKTIWKRQESMQIYMGWGTAIQDPVNRAFLLNEIRHHLAYYMAGTS